MHGEFCAAGQGEKRDCRQPLPTVLPEFHFQFAQFNLRRRSRQLGRSDRLARFSPALRRPSLRVRARLWLTGLMLAHFRELLQRQKLDLSFDRLGARWHPGFPSTDVLTLAVPPSIHLSNHKACFDSLPDSGTTVNTGCRNRPPVAARRRGPRFHLSRIAKYLLSPRSAARIGGFAR
jgi:hypothetical protein